MWFRTLLCFTLLFFALRADPSFAQEPPPGPIARELGLNAEQLKRFEAVMQAERASMDKVRSERQRIHAQTRSQLAAFLTPEQLKRFDDARPGKEPPVRERGRRAPPASQ